MYIWYWYIGTYCSYLAYIEIRVFERNIKQKAIAVYTSYVFTVLLQFFGWLLISYTGIRKNYQWDNFYSHLGNRKNLPSNSCELNNMSNIIYNIQQYTYIKFIVRVTFSILSTVHPPSSVLYFFKNSICSSIVNNSTMLKALNTWRDGSNWICETICEIHCSHAALRTQRTQRQTALVQINNEIHSAIFPECLVFI